MSLIRVFPYKGGSESAKGLAAILKVLRVKPDGNYSPKFNHTIINWGNSKSPVWETKAVARRTKILNKFNAVKIASNKLLTLQLLAANRVNVPQFTTDMDIAQDWLDEGEAVFERHTLNGNSAAGIRIVKTDGENDAETILTRAPLYTRFIPKTREFRVHVFNGQVIDYVEKKKRGTENRGENFNPYVCSADLGWVFCRTEIAHIDSVKTEATKAVRALGLDFGAVDIVYYEETPYVLEVNTAPGLMGTTVYRYANAIRRYVGLPEIVEVTETGLGMQQQAVRQPAVQAPPTNNNRVNVQAANRALVLDDNMVQFTLDKATARVLKTLLNSVNLTE